MPIGLELPFSLSSGSNSYFSTSETELDAAKFNILSLLITNWGERVMLPTFGCNLVEFLFENTRNDDLKTKIADRIISQVSKWIPYVGIKELNILFDTDDISIKTNTIKILISFYLSDRPGMFREVQHVIESRG